MNTILFLNKDLEANLGYNLLKKELLNHSVKIYYSESVGNNNNKPKELQEIEYYEKSFIYDELIPIIKRENIVTSFEFFDNEFETFPLSKCINVTSTQFINEIKQFQPDLFISIRFGKIFREEIIQAR